MARLAGTSKRSVQSWESNRYLPSGPALERLLEALEVSGRERDRLLAEATPSYARTRLAHTPLGAPVHSGQVLRAIRLRQGTTQAAVARGIGVSQGTLAKWESGEDVPADASLEAALVVLGASEAEERALWTARRCGGAAESRDLEDRIDQVVFDLPLSLRDPVLLGFEAELWWRAMRNPGTEALLSRIVAARAQQSILRGALDEVEGLARRAIRIARVAGAFESASSAVYAACWTSQRRPGGAIPAARTLGRWADMAQVPEVRNWLRAAQGLALTRGGEFAEGIALLHELERRAADRGWKDLVYHRNDLAEGYLMARQPQRAFELLLSLGNAAPSATFARACLALGQEPPAATIEDVCARTDRDWLSAQEAAQIERGLADLRRGVAARFA